MISHIHNGSKIPEFEAGSRDTVFSAERLNQIVRATNALLNPSIVRTDNQREVVISDSNYVLAIHQDD